MNMQEIWRVAEPYIMTVVGALGGGTVIYALARILLGRLLSTFATKYDTNDMADKVAGKLAGKTLNIDVTAVTEQRLDKLSKLLTNQLENIREETESYKRLLSLIGGAIAKLKAITPEEKTALTEAITALDNSYIPAEPSEITTVKLEPIALPKEPDAQPSDLRML